MTNIKSSNAVAALNTDVGVLAQSTVKPIPPVGTYKAHTRFGVTGRRSALALRPVITRLLATFAERRILWATATLIPSGGRSRRAASYEHHQGTGAVNELYSGQFYRLAYVA
jgi:hypothetical protein